MFSDGHLANAAIRNLARRKQRDAGNCEATYSLSDFPFLKAGV